MNRSSRIALTAAVASALIAGAAGAVALGPLGAVEPATAAVPGAQPGTSQPAASAHLDEALSRLTREADGLRTELAAARRRLGSASAQARDPVVHTRTGASTSSDHDQDHDQDHEQDD